MKNSPMPSLTLGRFNLAYARLRGCFLKRPVENSMKRTMPSLRSESFMLTSLVHNLNEVQSLCSVKSFMTQQGAIVIREKNT